MRFGLTRLGLGALLVLGALVGLAVAASGTAQVVGFVGAIIVAIGLVGGVPMRGGIGSDILSSTLQGRTVNGAEPQALDEAPVDEKAWLHERERREAAFRERGAAQEGQRAESRNPFGSKSTDG